MQKNDSFAHILNFEDYKLEIISDSCFESTYNYYVPYRFLSSSSGTYVINQNLPVRVSVDYSRGYYNRLSLEENEVIDHKELLNNAGKVFVHPSCKLSRSMLASKYKKNLNPYLADVVVIPEPDFRYVYLQKYALFINESKKIIFMIGSLSHDTEKYVMGLSNGTKFKDAATTSPSNLESPNNPYSISDLLDSELFYCGDLIQVYKNENYILDILAGRIPLDKIVFESTIQKSLSDASNQLDFDSLTSIMDMLKSSDADTVSAGLKTLSMMDWMHYSQSVKFILTNTGNSWNWKYNKACDSTSVKYMLKTISSVRSRSRWPGSFDNEIYEKDFELFKQLKCHYDSISPENVLGEMRYYEFMTVSRDGNLYPRLIVE